MQRIPCEDDIAWNVFANDLYDRDVLNTVPYLVKGTYSSYGNGHSFARHGLTLARSLSTDSFMSTPFCTWACLWPCDTTQLLASTQGAVAFSIRHNSSSGVKLSLTLIQFVNMTDNSIYKFLGGFERSYLYYPEWLYSWRSLESCLWCTLFMPVSHSIDLLKRREMAKKKKKFACFHLFVVLF